MIFVVFCVSILGGLAGHQARNFTRHIQNGWRNLAEHGIGGLLLVPFILLFWLTNGGKKEEVPRLFSAILGALLGVGAGVSAGYMLDNVGWKDA